MIELLQGAAVTAAKLTEGRGSIRLTVEVEGVRVSGLYRGKGAGFQVSEVVAWGLIGSDPDRLEGVVRSMGAKIAAAFADDTPPPRQTETERARKLAAKDRRPSE